MQQKCLRCSRQFDALDYYLVPLPPLGFKCRTCRHITQVSFVSYLLAVSLLSAIWIATTLAGYVLLYYLQVARGVTLNVVSYIAFFGVVTLIGFVAGFTVYKRVVARGIIKHE